MSIILHLLCGLIVVCAWSFLGMFWLSTLNDLHARRTGNAEWWPKWYQVLPAGPVVWAIVLVGKCLCDEPTRPEKFTRRPMPRFTRKPPLPEPKSQTQNPKYYISHVD